MKPRIVILSAFLTPFRSGAEACAEEMPLQLVDQFDFTIITARLRRNLPHEDVLRFRSGGSRTSATKTIPVIRVGLGFWFDKWLYPFLAPREAKKYHPQIVHAILETFAGEALMRCRKILPNAKRILTLQTTNRTFRKKKIIQSADKVTAISKHLASIANNLGRENIVVISNGIPYEEIRRSCEKFSKEKGRVLYVGRLEHMKGVDTVIQAFLQFHEKHPSYQLHVVGSGSLFESFHSKYSGLQHIKICGALTGDSLLREYAEAEVFCGLSRSEGLGNVFLEAQAAGCVVITTNIGGIPEIVHDQKTGVLVSPDDVNAAARTLEALTQERVKETMAKNGIKNAEGYDWKLIANRYAEIYKSFTL